MGENCCSSPPVVGAYFHRTYVNDGSSVSGEAAPATISTFRLDRYLVTVGRFRTFVTAWRAGWTPPAGAGKHLHLNNGRGLRDVSVSADAASAYETGWIVSDNGNLALSDGNLSSSVCEVTWTPQPGSNENLPMSCVNWYEAYAFCIWDGGFLPSEAEWEYVAAGGIEEREYPWGNVDPGTTNQYAIYGCYYNGGGPRTCNPYAANIAPVGTASFGVGRWGQLDLEGELWEWNLDWFVGAYVTPCTDCAIVEGGTLRSIRGGDYETVLTLGALLPTFRNGSVPTNRSISGLRCARAP